MKKLTLCVWLILLTACHKSNDDEPGYTPPSTEDVEVSFSGNVSVITSSASISRAPINNTTFDEGAEIGIYGMVANVDNMATIGWSYNTVLQDAMTNAKYTATTHILNEGGLRKQTLVQDEIAKFPRRESPTSPDPALVFYAYHPYTTDVRYNPNGAPNAPVIPVLLNPSDMSKTPDYMYAKSFSKATVNPILLTFDHLLARMDFHLYTDIPDFGFAPGEVGSPILKEVRVYQNKQYSATFDLSKIGSLSPNNAGSSLPLVYPNVSYSIEQRGEDENRFTGVSYLLFPTCLISKIVFVILTEKGVERDFTVYQYVAGSEDPLRKQIPLERGKITKMTIKYTREIVNDATISGWEESISLDGFTVSDLNPAP